MTRSNRKIDRSTVQNSKGIFLTTRERRRQWRAWHAQARQSLKSQAKKLRLG